MNEFIGLAPEITTILAALGGGGIGTGLAQYFLKRAVAQLESVPEKLADLKSELTIIKHRLDQFHSLQIDVKSHEKRIILMEAEMMNGKHHSYQSSYDRAHHEGSENHEHRS